MKIGIFTSSVPVGSRAPERGRRAIKFLESKGHEVIKGNLFDKADFYRSGTIAQRAQEINDLLEQDIDVLMASVGGYVTNSILPYINFEKMNREGFIICGFSDITAILNATLLEAPKARALYGPGLFKGFGNFEEYLNEFTYDSFMKQVNKENQIEIDQPEFWNEEFINWEEFERPRKMILNEWKSINHNQQTISGILRGGNLSTLQGIWGSKYQPQWNKGDILFVEDACYNPETIERFFSMLKLNGIYDKVAAIVLGKHELFDDQGTGRKPIDVLLEVLGPNCETPIIYDVDFCHTQPMAIIELNQKTIIDFKEMRIYQ
ncbi:S66 family peptidase [[Acholeplasma] multilocale]|uniref:S66 family peptidase n=1 Tax=[Acholeplasma] multilocale TaxID=264638 RepID=UPI00054DEE5F|nr:S66 peptidase family protein [[Acholeplasma] multilocale]